MGEEVGRVLRRDLMRAREDAADEHAEIVGPQDDREHALPE
jgi:hypothetical protein